MSDYIPTTENIRELYVYGCGDQDNDGSEFDRWLNKHDIDNQEFVLAWERERFQRLLQIERGCFCGNSMEHLLKRLNRTENGIDYDLEFLDSNFRGT